MSPCFLANFHPVTRRDALPNMTEQAHCADILPANHNAAVKPQTMGGNPGDRPVVVAALVAQRMVRPPEIGGPQGPEPTRFGDWELRGRCIDF